MGRPPVALGAEAERARVLAADRGLQPWRQWRAVAEGPVFGIADAGQGIRLDISLAPGHRVTAAAGERPTPGPVQLASATPTYSFVEAVQSIEGEKPVVAVRTSAAADPSLSCELRITAAKRRPEDVILRLVIANRGPESVMAGLIARLSFTDAPSEGAAGPSSGNVQATWGSVRPGIRDGMTLLCAARPGVATWWLSATDGALDTDTRDGTGGVSATVRFDVCVAPGSTATTQLRLCRGIEPRAPVGPDAAATLGTRGREAAAFHDALLPRDATVDERAAGRAALAALLAGSHGDGLHTQRTFSALALAVADPEAAKARLLASLDHRLDAPGNRLEPPIDAWAALRIHELGETFAGALDHAFLEGVFRFLLDDYSRWVDRVDDDGRNALQGGVIGLDGTSDSVAGTAWMGCYSVWMLALAIELARDDPTYEDVAVTFLDMSLAMIGALDDLGGSGSGMWDESEDVHRDVARTTNGGTRAVPGRSAVGLVPLIGLAVIERSALERLPELAVRLSWSLRHRPELADVVIRERRKHGLAGDALVTLVSGERRMRSLEQHVSWQVELSAALTCLLFDTVDRLRAFGAGVHREHPSGPDARRLAEIGDRLVEHLGSHAPGPPWLVLLSGVLRRSR